MKNSFIHFDGNMVEVTFKFNVKESDRPYVHVFDYSKFYEIMREALLQRIKHCRKVLITEILEADDVKMMNGGKTICSDTVSKHFSVRAYERMGEIMSIMGNVKSFADFAKRLNRYDVAQMWKALNFAKFENVEEDVLRECADVLGEFVCIIE